MVGDWVLFWAKIEIGGAEHMAQLCMAQLYKAQWYNCAIAKLHNNTRFHTLTIRAAVLEE